MSRDRLRSMQRIVAVQAQRRQLAEWKLAEIDSQKAAIATARTDLGTYMERADLAGPLAVLALAQTRRLAEREALAEEERQRQRAVLQAAERRHRLAERIMDSVATEQRMLEERRDLERLIESAVSRAQQLGPERT